MPDTRGIKKGANNMPSPGTKPIPTNLKLLTGNPGKRAISKKEPMPDAVIPDPPSHLDAYALEEWRRITPVLLGLGLISDLTMPSVAAYCDAFSDWRTATEELNRIKEKKGTLAALIQVTKNNNVIPNQLKLVAKAARADMVKYAAEFGGTEVAKARMGIDLGKHKKGKFSGLLNVGNKKK